jgi:hypothetical protein
MKIRIRQLVLGTALAAVLMAGAAAIHTTSTFAMQFHCHNLNRIDYWVMTGTDTPAGGVYCHGSM